MCDMTHRRVPAPLAQTPQLHTHTHSNTLQHTPPADAHHRVRPPTSQDMTRHQKTSHDMTHHHAATAPAPASAHADASLHTTAQAPATGARAHDPLEHHLSPATSAPPSVKTGGERFKWKADGLGPLQQGMQQAVHHTLHWTSHHQKHSHLLKEVRVCVYVRVFCLFLSV